MFDVLFINANIKNAVPFESVFKFFQTKCFLMPPWSHSINIVENPLAIVLLYLTIDNAGFRVK